jgi:DNA-binding XRE family transcriptional regulator
MIILYKPLNKLMQDSFVIPHLRQMICIAMLFKDTYNALMSRKSLLIGWLPLPVRQSIRELGENIRIARQRRRQTQAEFAARMMVSVPTVRRLEKGDPAVALAVYYTALWALGLISEARGMAKPEKDQPGNVLDLERLPERVRHARRSV